MKIQRNAHLLFLLFFLSFSLQKISAQCYELVWSEEFEYTGYPDPAVWNMEVGNNNGANSEAQYYTKNDSDNCYVSDGRLLITALKENLGGQAYTSARINTKGRFDVQYGKVEGRMKLPYGQGIWPAFWMLGANISQVSWPACGEIDIMELIGGTGYNDRTTYGTPHFSNASGAHGQGGSHISLPSGRFADDYHVFSIEWTPQKIVWFLDGTQFYSFGITPSYLSEFHQKFFIILNLAVGGTWPGYPDASTVFPQKFEVDYVRVYKQVDTETISGKEKVLSREKELSYSLSSAEGRQFLWSVPDGATILSRADSNAVVVNWGCDPGEIVCDITTSCGTSVKMTKAVSVAEPVIEGPVFFDKAAGNLIFSVPAMDETTYKWEIPEGASFVTGDTAASAEVVWGDAPGTVKLSIDNNCGITSLEKKIYKYGQYPYPDPDSPHIIPGTINSTDFDYGGEGVAYHDNDVANQGTGPRKDERVDTENQPTFSNVGWVTNGEWLSYTIKVPTAGFYKIEVQTASNNTANIGPLRILVNGESRVADIPVPPTASWSKFVTISQRLLELHETDTVLSLMAVNGGFNIGPITLSPDNTVSVKEYRAGSGKISAFPNPVADELHLRFYLSEPDDIKIYLMDISGKQLFSFLYENIQSGGQELSLPGDIAGLKSGMYFIKIEAGGETNFCRFIKE
ncbi:MAG: family 16 glycosylhydrolase [Bacteroidales bacterium]|nr:family 16 glycosylhydrolase [Bacteroidales bacterium]MCB9000163.1 family 16 glycosylhydrolase [Bacteroidales bacterium]MCB9012712.1 family 16 glycosylhydrolase [Bacteroidales bacterium]